MNYPESIIYFLILLQVYLVIRFAVKCSFRFTDAYQFKYILIAAFVPFAGYFIAINLVKRKADTVRIIKIIHPLLF